MSAPPDRALRVAAWVNKAEDDFRSAEHLLKMDEPPFDIVCFHAQQCAEKYIKAFLVWLNVDFPKTHDLAVLTELIPEPLVPGLCATEVIPLNRCSIEPRYPGPWETFGAEDAEEAMQIARSVRNEIRRHLPDLTVTGCPA